MNLWTRKLIVVGVVAVVIFLANTRAIAGWLDDVGVVAWARNLRSEYLTGGSLVVIVIMLFLLDSPIRHVVGASWLKRCPVCNHLLGRQGRYCSECGSRV